MAEQPFDDARSEAFSGKMVDILNHASLALMMSIGHKLALFDAMASLPSATIPEIAAEAGLQERYVREWMGAMLTGGIVEYDDSADAFTLPPEHAAWLTRQAGVNNLAMQTQYIPLLAQVEAPLIECFREGGGVPYSSYPAFQRLMAEDSTAVQDTVLLDVTLPLVPGIIDRLTDGIDVLDVGCGSGHALNLMAQAFPNSRFTGYDFSHDGVQAGRDEARRLGLTNVQFEERDVSKFDDGRKFDFITAFDAIHDQAKPAQVLKNIATALRPDGTFLMVDIAASSRMHENIEHPLGPLGYTISTMHCMTVSLALGGEGLGAMWGEQKAVEMLNAAGFDDVGVTRVEGDFLNNYYVARRTNVA
ncbi:MAG: class I SAM-dependent methyltransferase [Thermomicrobiales bacterium]